MNEDKLTLDNICLCAVPEVFQRSLKEVLKNIRDTNTSAAAERTITLQFKFKPHSDRSGADITFSIKEGLAGIEPIKGVMYVAGKNETLKAYASDPRQEVLFTDQPSNTQ
jgi:hypothetical protein